MKTTLKELPPKSLFIYSSYRLFLKDRFLSEKRSSRRTTLALYAAELGFSTSGLNMIFSGERNFPLDKIHSVAHLLRLTDPEQDFFEALILKEHTEKDPYARRYYARKLKQICTNAGTNVQGTRTSDHRIVSEWFVPELLIRMIDFEKKKNPTLDFEKLDFEELGAHFKMKGAHMRKLVQSLSASGLLSIDTKDQIHILFDKVLSRLSQKTHVQAVHRELGNRIQADFEKSSSVFRTFTFAMRATALPELKSELMKVYEKYMATMSEKPAENEVFQSLVGLFPV